MAETFNLEGLPGYSTGGTLHLIANNQVGFTTDPTEGRSTRYSSDLAKGFDAPIIHVNADDAEAAVSATRLAMAFRERFGHDVVVDLVGYRRFGHNEQDEPAYTQPLMAQAIADHPTVRAQLAERLVADGEVTAEEAERMVAETHEAMRAAHDRLREAIAEPHREETRTPPAGSSDVITAVAADRLRGLDRELVAVPERFTVHPKLVRQLERRADALEEGGIDWGHAEALALGSLLVEGIPVRLTGQDTERGTFSHRHLVLHDAVTGERYAPIQHLTDAEASIELHNSPLSEYGALGFDYGYSVAAPETLVLWEAQFGDFVNGAQIIIDQFLVSGLSKWNQTSRLTLLLPHGYEGNGPEHSSARLERFLQSAAQENIRVANPSTAAQYFHLLRRQALDARPRPLVTMTPKGLLRLGESAATLEELSTGGFAPVLDDPSADHAQARTLVFCSGKIFYDIAGHESRAGKSTVSVIRIDQLYPFPARALAELLAAYPSVEEIVWAQEEPQNMGAYRSIRHRLEDALPSGVPLRYVGRPWRASPSEGYPTAHLAEQERIVSEALGASSRRLLAALDDRRRRGRSLGAVDACLVEHHALLRGRQPPPQLVGCERHPDRALRRHGRHPRRGKESATSSQIRYNRPRPETESEVRMPVETASFFSQVIEDHVELKRRNSSIEESHPIDRYLNGDPFENHPLFKTEEQARIEETMGGEEPAVVAHVQPGPGEEKAEEEDSLWGRTRDFDWGD